MEGLIAFGIDCGQLIASELFTSYDLLESFPTAGLS